MAPLLTHPLQTGRAPQIGSQRLEGNFPSTASPLSWAAMLGVGAFAAALLFRRLAV
ncbi:MAG: hypothetical protein WDO18_12250 [Acidobacteriota bacterium]